MKAKIAVLPGDGIGPEVTLAAVHVLKAVAARFDHQFTIAEGLIGGCAIDATGEPLPDATRALCQDSNAVLLGAVGGPAWSDPDAKVRPEQGLLELRRFLGLYANVRPVAPRPALFDASPLKADLLEAVDLVVVRELTGGIYFGEKTRTLHDASDLCVYTIKEIERIVRTACRLARTRRSRLTSVDKANVLETSRLWRSVTQRVVQEEFPEIELEHLLVDAAAMHLISRPRDFDVIVTENMFGDILTDEASMLSGSLGLLPSASLGDAVGAGLYEPIHGSAPTIAGRGIANPYGCILSAALLLRHSLELPDEAAAVEAAVDDAINGGLRTVDICVGGEEPVDTEHAVRGVVARIAAKRPANEVLH
ncbi:MAG: 3-isopropylmalate dehydrogenase [Pseudomonadota bacterium]